LVNGQYRPLTENLELCVGDHRRDFDNPVAIGLEPRHFEVEPNQVRWILGHRQPIVG